MSKHEENVDLRMKERPVGIFQIPKDLKELIALIIHLTPDNENLDFDLVRVNECLKNLVDEITNSDDILDMVDDARSIIKKLTKKDDKRKKDDCLLETLRSLLKAMIHILSQYHESVQEDLIVCVKTSDVQLQKQLQDQLQAQSQLQERLQAQLEAQAQLQKQLQAQQQKQEQKQGQILGFLKKIFGHKFKKYFD